MYFNQELLDKATAAGWKIAFNFERRSDRLSETRSGADAPDFDPR